MPDLSEEAFERSSDFGNMDDDEDYDETYTRWQEAIWEDERIYWADLKRKDDA